MTDRLTGNCESGEIMIEIQGNTYTIVKEYRNAWDQEAFKERYSDVLNKFDYIVGDWGYDQLRLKGFYEDKNRKSPHESRIAFLEEYLYEYCNFGCAYFILKKEKKQKKQPDKKAAKEPEKDMLNQQ